MTTPLRQKQTAKFGQNRWTDIQNPRQTVPASSPLRQKEGTLAHVSKQGHQTLAGGGKARSSAMRCSFDKVNCFVSFAHTLKIRDRWAPVPLRRSESRTQENHQAIQA